MNILNKIIFDPIAKSLDNILIFLPNIMTSLFIFILGVVISLVVKMILEGVFKTIGLDKLSMRMGFQELLQRGGITDKLSLFLAKFTAGFLFLVFTLLAMRALEVNIIERLSDKFLFYLPNIIIALLILLIGWLFGNFLGRTVLIAAVNAGIKFSRLAALFVKYLIIMLAATMALEHIGIGEKTVEIAFAVLFSGMVFAFSLALGLGGKDIARDFLERKIREDKEQKKDDGINYI